MTYLLLIEQMLFLSQLPDHWLLHYVTYETHTPPAITDFGETVSNLMKRLLTGFVSDSLQLLCLHS